MLDTVLRTKVLAINVKVNISKPFDAVKTRWNHQQITFLKALIKDAGRGILLNAYADQKLYIDPDFLTGCWVGIRGILHNENAYDDDDDEYVDQHRSRFLFSLKGAGRGILHNHCSKPSHNIIHCRCKL